VTAIRKHLVDFAAIIALMVVALIVGGVILANQRLALPGWVPGLGQDFTEVEAELSSAQAVTPGQGQTVNVAGVEVGEISGVRLEQGRAIVTMKLEEGSVPVYRDASVLLRPKTGLKDMVAELTPGTPEAGELPEDERIPIGQTLPDVNLDEILAALDGDTRDYLVMLLSGGAEGLRGNSDELANTIRRFEPLARDSLKISKGLAERRKNISRVIHNFSLLADALGDKDEQLGEFVENSNAVFAAFADQDANLRAALQELPAALDETTSALSSVDAMATELGPTLEALRPGARALGPALRETRPFLTETTPVLRDEIRPFVRAAREPVRQLGPAVRDLSAATPDLVNTFTVLNTLFDALAYNPPGEKDEGYLFWTAWVNHLGPAVFSNADAHGPIRRGLVVASCSTLLTLRSVVLGNPQLGALTQLLEIPAEETICPQNVQFGGGG
jgi:phospholipid/cholesterol/gamma-HCH transport system substrate-binding protein